MGAGHARMHEARIMFSEAIKVNSFEEMNSLTGLHVARFNFECENSQAFVEEYGLDGWLVGVIGSGVASIDSRGEVTPAGTAVVAVRGTPRTL